MNNISKIIAAIPVTVWFLSQVIFAESELEKWDRKRQEGQNAVLNTGKQIVEGAAALSAAGGSFSQAGLGLSQSGVGTLTEPVVQRAKQISDQFANADRGDGFYNIRLDRNDAPIIVGLVAASLYGTESGVTFGALAKNHLIENDEAVSVRFFAGNTSLIVVTTEQDKLSGGEERTVAEASVEGTKAFLEARYCGSELKPVRVLGGNVDITTAGRSAVCVTTDDSKGVVVGIDVPERLIGPYVGVVADLRIEAGSAHAAIINHVDQLCAMSPVHGVGTVRYLKSTTHKMYPEYKLGIYIYPGSRVTIESLGLQRSPPLRLTPDLLRVLRRDRSPLKIPLSTLDMKRLPTPF